MVTTDLSPLFGLWECHKWHHAVVHQPLKLASFTHNNVPDSHLGLQVVFYSISHVQLSCNPVDHTQLGSSVHGISQARILEWVAISFSWGSSQPKDWTCVSCISRQILYHWTTWEAQLKVSNSSLLCIAELCEVVPQFLYWFIHRRVISSWGVGYEWRAINIHALYSFSHPSTTPLTFWYYIIGLMDHVYFFLLFRLGNFYWSVLMFTDCAVSILLFSLSTELF